MALDLSLYTVETHRGNLLEKLGLHGTADVILYAVRKGIIDPIDRIDRIRTY